MDTYRCFISLDKLPDDIICCLGLGLPLADLLNLSLVCKKINLVLCSDHFWGQKHLQDFGNYTEKTNLKQVYIDKLKNDNTRLFILECCAYDYYEYNCHGPRERSTYGERIFINIDIREFNKSRYSTFTVDVDIRHYLIVSPAGRVIKSGKIKENKQVRWNPLQCGIYLLKLWTESVDPDFFHIQFKNIKSAKVKIWSPLSSNKDGCIFESGEKCQRSNSIFIGMPKTRHDRRKTSYKT
uniref:F-box family protein n=1 Tax=Marseillevirus LCMAC102 TaxID=2506603 RepID=A0A481YTV5_9VIRU|nr:MAG: F-box family protein [Marseillevirus LCMAC102]